jgi:F0F1-type ATP synthase membrane subunit b/b'
VGGFVDGQFTGQAALTEAQAQSLTAREISRIRAEKEYDYAARLAEAQASIQREKIRALADAQAKVESQKVSSLGEVQSQRLQSQYGAASNLLDSAIKNIAFRDKIESANTLTELARAV